MGTHPSHVGVGSLGNLLFRIDPSSVSWSYTVKVAVTKTIGGKVVQVYGVSIDDMMVSGSFGVGDWAEQDAFLESMLNLAQNQDISGQPVRFSYLPKGWDFQVYLKGYNQTGQGQSIVKDERIINPGWDLTLFIVDDPQGSGLRQIRNAAIDGAIARVADGLAWKPSNAFNGPGIEEWMSSGDVTAGERTIEGILAGAQALGGQDLVDAFRGVHSEASASTDSSGTNPRVTTGRTQ